MTDWLLSILLALSTGEPPVQNEDFVTYSHPDFELQYPEKSSRLMPPSASVTFSMEYDKDSFLRLEKENLLQPIDLADVSLATIFLQIQLEQVRRRVSQPVLSHEIKTYPWGQGVEIVYRWQGGDEQLYKVVEVSTTCGSTLFRLTYCVKEEDEKSERVLSTVVDRFRPFKSPVATPDSGAAPAIAENKEMVVQEDARLA